MAGIEPASGRIIKTFLQVYFGLDKNRIKTEQKNLFFFAFLIRRENQAKEKFFSFEKSARLFRNITLLFAFRNKAMEWLLKIKSKAERQPV